MHLVTAPLYVAIFFDRKDESKRIVDTLTNGNNMALLAPRRYGKTIVLRNEKDYHNYRSQTAIYQSGGIKQINTL